MPRYYRALLTTFLAGALAAPAFAQTPAPVPPAASSAAAAPAADTAGAPPATAKTPEKPVVHKHRHAARTKTSPLGPVAKPGIAPPPASTK